jgi:hypothetical protein
MMSSILRFLIYYVTARRPFGFFIIWPFGFFGPSDPLAGPLYLP